MTLRNNHQNAQTAKLSESIGTAALALLWVSACTNGSLPKVLPSPTSSELATQILSATNYKISNVKIEIPAGSTATVPTTRIFFDSAKSPGFIKDVCSPPSTNSLGSNACLCRFTWQEINQTTGTAVPIPREVLTTVNEVQDWNVACKAPDRYSSEIAPGTVVKVSVIPGSGNTNALSMTPYNYTKGASGPSGSFQDAQGRYFDNILRYSCFEMQSRSLALKNKVQEISQDVDSTTNTARVVLASQFCVQKRNGDQAPSDSCQGTPPPQWSAESYYYNLYIPDSNRGGINFSNARYVCPQVREPILKGNSAGLHYPLDTTFALSVGPTVDFPIGVEAFTKLSNGADPQSQPSSCGTFSPTGPGATPTPSPAATEAGNGSPGNASLIQGCLGFAAKPSKDGTCPSFNDSTGKIRQTYRLRRFIAIYPPFFDSNGEVVRQGQASDTIYVLDRPVSSPNANPLKPYTMRGPKPCPFSWYDRTGVTGKTDPSYPGKGELPTYAATNSDSWNRKNVDGIQFPNFDSSKENSCSAVIPLINETTGYASLGTVNERNPKFRDLHVRPRSAWAPHYEEDLDFQACAPQPSPGIIDPPLHFAKDATTGNIGWCAEAYPTQNEDISAIDKRPDVTAGNPTPQYFGKVSPFTSHVAKNSASAQCQRTLPGPLDPALGAPLASFYPSALLGTACPAPGGLSDPVAVALHPEDYIADMIEKIDGAGAKTVKNVCASNTCDRTVIKDKLPWGRFPLLARPVHVERAISTDTTFGCTITYDGGGGKSGKTSPKGGCCSSTVLETGIADPSNNGNARQNQTAHLEPDVPCGIPAY